MINKIKSGVYGLNPLLEGGLNERSTTVVIGKSGAGKTTFATQFIKKGLEDGQEAIFVSLDENKEQIIRDAIQMGWDEIIDYIEENKLVFIDATGRDFSSFIRKELPDFVAKWSGANTRIVIDPLTPVVWAVKDRYVQRELLGFMLKETKKIGTVLATLEEYPQYHEFMGEETMIPIYLADCVIHLDYSPEKDQFDRTLRIIKSRSSKHSERPHHYKLIKGLGVVVKREGYKIQTSKKIITKMKKDLKEKSSHLSPIVYKRIYKMLDELTDEDLEEIDIEELIVDIIEEYK